MGAFDDLNRDFHAWRARRDDAEAERFEKSLLIDDECETSDRELRKALGTPRYEEHVMITHAPDSTRPGRPFKGIADKGAAGRSRQAGYQRSRRSRHAHQGPSCRRVRRW